MTLPSPSGRRLLPLVTLVLLVACAAPAAPDDPVDSDETPPASTGGNEPVLVVVDADPGGPAITVEEALGHAPTDDVVVVSGALFVERDGRVRLCDAIAESFPPQCGGASIAVEGIDLGTVELQSANGVRWAESVTLLGSVE